MIVKSNKPIKVSAYGNNEFSSLDGLSPATEILAFQKWANSKGEKLVDEDGLWNPSTSKLYSTVKKRYESETGEQIGKLASKKIETTVPVKEIVQAKPYSAIITPIPIKQGWWAKRSKTQKTIIVTSSIVLLGITLYVVSQKIVKK